MVEICPWDYTSPPSPKQEKICNSPTTHKKKRKGSCSSNHKAEKEKGREKSRERRSSSSKPSSERRRVSQSSDYSGPVERRRSSTRDPEVMEIRRGDVSSQETEASHNSLAQKTKPSPERKRESSLSSSYKPAVTSGAKMADVCPWDFEEQDTGERAWWLVQRLHFFCIHRQDRTAQRTSKEKKMIKIRHCIWYESFSRSHLSIKDFMKKRTFILLSAGAIKHNYLLNSKLLIVKLQWMQPWSHFKGIFSLHFCSPICQFHCMFYHTDHVKVICKLIIFTSRSDNHLSTNTANASPNELIEKWHMYPIMLTILSLSGKPAET